MVYHVMTGDINTKTSAKSHRQAAIQAIRYSKEAPGMCIIVNENEIFEHDSENVYFMTDSIMEECLSMRIVG
jgi:hypothetical protein